MIYNEEYFIARCELLGVKATEQGNPPVGAVIVKNGEIVAEAAEAGKSKNDITCHAEIEALRLAVKKLQSNDLSECVMYSTHEPCIMCSYAIRYYRVKKLVYLHDVDYLGGITSQMPLLISDIVPPHWGRPPEIVRYRKNLNKMV